MKVTVKIVDDKKDNLIACPVCGRLHPVELTMEVSSSTRVCYMCAFEMYQHYERTDWSDWDDSEIAMQSKSKNVNISVRDIRRTHDAFFRMLTSDQFVMNEYDDYMNLVMNMALRRASGCECSWKTIYEETIAQSALGKAEHRVKGIEAAGWDLDKKTYLRLVMFKTTPYHIAVKAAKHMIENALLPDVG